MVVNVDVDVVVVDYQQASDMVAHHRRAVSSLAASSGVIRLSESATVSHTFSLQSYDTTVVARIFINPTIALRATTLKLAPVVRRCLTRVRNTPMAAHHLSPVCTT